MFGQDDTLSEMMNFIEGGYRKKTEQDKLNFGMQLKQALEEFTDSFLPHMKEEEEVSRVSIFPDFL